MRKRHMGEEGKKDPEKEVYQVKKENLKTLSVW